MKVLMIAPLPPPTGGIASWALRYQEISKQFGIDLNIVNISMRGQRAESETKKRNLLDEFNRTISIVHNLKNELKSHCPDVVHLNTSCSPFGVLRDAICVRLASRRAPVVLHCHCNIEDQLGLKWIQVKAFNYLVKKSKSVIVLNHLSKCYVDQIEKDKATIIPNFATPKMLHEDHCIRKNLKEILYVGHIEKAKGLGQIVDAAKMMPNYHFTLVGPCRDDISRMEISSNMEFVGRVDSEEVFNYLERADVFLLPSYSEGFSCALLEAMAAGLPVIATDVGANLDMIEAYGGIILKNNNAGKICEAIRQMDDPYVRLSMSKWNINRVKELYMIDKVMKKYKNVYEQILDSER